MSKLRTTKIVFSLLLLVICSSKTIILLFKYIFKGKLYREFTDCGQVQTLPLPHPHTQVNIKWLNSYLPELIFIENVHCFWPSILKGFCLLIYSDSRQCLRHCHSVFSQRSSRETEETSATNYVWHKTDALLLLVMYGTHDICLGLKQSTLRAAIENQEPAQLRGSGISKTLGGDGGGKGVCYVGRQTIGLNKLKGHGGQGKREGNRNLSTTARGGH